jgi:hypothetical protein
MSTVIVGTRDTSRWPEFAGSTWVRLQYLLGLRRLGVDSFWVDRLSAVDPRQHHHSLDYLLRRFDRTAQDFGLQGRCCIVYNDGERYFGMTEAEFRHLAGQADLLLNISGHLPPDSPLIRIPRRAFIDVDPGFTQIWAQQVDIGLERHNFFFTVGQNVGGPDFLIPLGGVDWVPILPPVVLEHWPPHIDPACQRFSTVADWRGSQYAVFEGESYSGKRREFLRFLLLPRRTRQPVEPAIYVGFEDSEDLELLLGNKWVVHDPFLYAGDPHSYREFIQYSRAEFSVAKGGYVKSNSGWVSDRTACYLASGKPALVQSTGFEGRLPAGKGLLTFRTLEEAMAGVRAINADYLSHGQAARQMAEEHFHSDVVLGRLLERVGLAG